MRVGTFDRRHLARLFLVAVGAAALLCALTGTAPGDVHLLPCPFRLVTGRPCPGCGMTRACVALFQGDLAAAWALQPFAFLLIPLALGAALGPERTSSAWRALSPLLRRSAVGLALGLCLVRWLGHLV